MVPFKVVIFEMSYDAAPWWANAGTETKRRKTTTSAGGPESFTFTGNLQLRATYSISRWIVNGIIPGPGNAKPVAVDFFCKANICQAIEAGEILATAENRWCLLLPA
jgi:hypothetical protein